MLRGRLTQNHLVVACLMRQADMCVCGQAVVCPIVRCTEYGGFVDGSKPHKAHVWGPRARQVPASGMHVGSMCPAVSCAGQVQVAHGPHIPTSTTLQHISVALKQIYALIKSLNSVFCGLLHQVRPRQQQLTHSYLQLESHATAIVCKKN
jgi:hypothetical protein